MNSKLVLISDFNISALARYISADESNAGLVVSETPYGQVFAALTKAYDKSISDFAFVWSRPESISACFSAALKGYEIDEQGCIDEITAFCETIKTFSQYFKNCFVASFTLSKDSIDYGLLDWKPGIGLSRLITILNLKMAEILSATDNIYILDANRWLLDGKADNLPKMWFAAKVPFHNNVYQCAAKNLLAAIDTVNGLGKRIIFLDLDNTLWGNVVGENGWKGIRLGGHDHVGEAFVDFQHKLKALSLRGIQLALVSKNEEAVALDAIDNHPDMVLKRSDFAGWRINWNDKAQNIADILSEINLGDYSAVFIDDNPVERDRVRSALPNLTVPEWPEDPSMYSRYLADLRCFDSPSLSKEDRSRTQSYSANRERVSLKVDSMTNWLEQLGTTVTVSHLDESNLQRASQLFNKTNQLNLSTRRLSAEELLNWSEADSRSTVVCSVRDKFGDLGLTGIVSIEMQGSRAYLIDFVLSCRVMGREVEEALIFIASGLATKMSARTIKIAYIETDRNIPTLSVLESSALIKSKPHSFYWDCSLKYAQPSSVTIEYK